MSTSNSAATISQVERFHFKISGEGNCLDAFAGSNGLSLAAASELACILDGEKSQRMFRAVDAHFAGDETWEMFRTLRVKSGPARVHSGSLSLAQIPNSYDESWLVGEARKFEKSLLAAQFPQVLSQSLTGAVFEMVDNVWRHSGHAQGALLGYQVKGRAFSVVVTDMGDGVLSTLTKNRLYSHLKTSIEALEEAVKPNVSGDVNGSGLGLDSLTRALASLWGRTRLRSGQGALTFNREGENAMKTHQFLPQLKGFQLSAICRLSRPSLKKVDKSHYVHYSQ